VGARAFKEGAENPRGNVTAAADSNNEIGAEVIEDAVR